MGRDACPRDANMVGWCIRHVWCHMWQGVVLLVIYCDLTLIDIHTGGHWQGDVEELVGKVWG